MVWARAIWSTTLQVPTAGPAVQTDAAGGRQTDRQTGGQAETVIKYPNGSTVSRAEPILFGEHEFWWRVAQMIRSPKPLRRRSQRACVCARIAALVGTAGHAERSRTNDRISYERPARKIWA